VSRFLWTTVYIHITHDNGIYRACIASRDKNTPTDRHDDR